MSDIACWKCGGNVAPPSSSELSPFCAACGVIQDLAPGLTHFRVLGFPPSLNLDSEKLRDRFYELSRKVHPDKFANSPSPEPSYALRWSTAVNRAYQTLRDPAARAHYLLESENFALPEKAQVPLDLAEAYFDLQDLLSEPQGEAKMAEFRGGLQLQLDGADGEWSIIADGLDSGNDRAGWLTRLQNFLTKQRYLRSMIADLDRKGGSHGHRGN